ncbi:MAG: DUF3013 family protein [Enterococcus sp.]
MAKKTILTYLDERLNKKITEYDVALDWDAKNHTIEVVFRLFAENTDQVTIDDLQGVASEEEIIEFEDGVLLYNPQKSKFDAEDYLATIAYEGKKGSPQALLDGLVDYLQEVLDQGQSDLLDFLTDESEEAVFELNWDAAEFAAVCQKYEKGKEIYLAYPSY